jgi:hypothetical protein
VWKFLMNSKFDSAFRLLAALILAITLGTAISGCASGPLGRKLQLEDNSLEAALVYYQSLSRMTPAELVRERTTLGTAQQIPFTQVRIALLLGHPRAPQDLGKGLALLEGVFKSAEPAAQTFHPLARQLADNYLERMKLESQIEKQGQQLKESQRKTAELQEKLDSLANIEKTLTPRPRASRPDGARQ